MVGFKLWLNFRKMVGFKNSKFTNQCDWLTDRVYSWDPSDLKILIGSNARYHLHKTLRRIFWVKSWVNACTVCVSKNYINIYIYIPVGEDFPGVNKKPQKFIFEYWVISQKSYLNVGCFEEIHICIPKIRYLHTS